MLKVLAIAAMGCLAVNAPAFSQTNYPTGIVKLVVGFPPGQATDLVARIMARKLQDVLAQPVFVENKPGASGIIGTFKAPPSFDKNKFWTETFQVATIAKTLAQEAKVMDPETAFTCALIHNIGELLIQSTLPEEAELINMALQNGSSRVEAQREMLGYDYAQLGAELARRWNLSEAFVDAISQQLF